MKTYHVDTVVSNIHQIKQRNYCGTPGMMLQISKVELSFPQVSMMIKFRKIWKIFNGLETILERKIATESQGLTFSHDCKWSIEVHLNFPCNEKQLCNTHLWFTASYKYFSFDTTAASVTLT